VTADRAAASADDAATRNPRRLGDVLVDRGFIDTADLYRALAVQARTDPDGRGHRRLGSVIVELGLASDEQVSSALADLLGRELVDVGQLLVDPMYARMLPRSLAERGLVLVLGDGPAGLRVLTADPTDVLTLDDVRRHTGVQRLDVLVAPPGQVRALVDRSWSLEHSGDAVADLGSGDDGEDDETAVSEAPTVRLLDSILADAVRGRASDVHLEQQSDGIRVRYRVDGVMRDVVTMSRTAGRLLVARAKIVAGMNIAERRLPQDGRMRLTVDGRPHDARVSTMPAIHGEKAVVRLLPGASSVQRLEDLGLEDDQRDALRAALLAPQGLVLITGPTGSGKTNTLYAGLKEAVTSERNVVTLEDPVEIELPGITQVQVDERTGMTFARGLRALLRQDPDVVLVGECRDTVTAELALKAALTGHLVLTTLHTNDAPSALPRLVDMGVEPYLVGSALSLVVAQRLVRQPCPDCVEAYEPDPAVLLALGVEPGAAVDGEPAQPRRGTGCTRCGRTGYLGRRGVFEILEISGEMRRLLLTRPNDAAIVDLARESGFRGLREQAVRMAHRGETTYEEALRVTRVTV
jgi:type IV pilus assembly protein PilB